MVCDGAKTNCSAVARSGPVDGGGARSDFSQKSRSAIREPQSKYRTFVALK
jgi:hypothetical protein